MNINKQTESLIKAILEYQESFDKGSSDNESEFDSISVILDFLGIPKDNTVEAQLHKADEDQTEGFHEEIYCRDWIYHLWDNELITGLITMDSFISQILCEAGDHCEFT